MITVEEWLTSAGLPPERTRFCSLSPVGKSLVLSNLRERAPSATLAIFSSRAEARAVADNLAYFAGAANADRVHYIPNIDFDFYRGVLHNPEVLCERNIALYHALNDPKGRIFITTLSTLMQKVFPPDEFLSATIALSSGDAMDRDHMIQLLVAAGYQRQPAATDPGIFAVRGGVVDVFSPNYDKPLRIEFLGDFAEEIRFFDPSSQLSDKAISQISIIPVGISLVPQGEAYDVAALKVKDRLDHLGILKGKREDILDQVKAGSLAVELGFLFPLFSGGSTSLCEYFSNDALFVWDGEDKLQEQMRETELPALNKHLSLFEKEPLPVAEGKDLFLTEDEMRTHFSRPHTLFFEEFATKEMDSIWRAKTHPISLANERGSATAKHSGSASLGVFATRFQNWIDEGYRIQIVCHTQTHVERVRALFETYALHSRAHKEGEAAWPLVAQTNFQELNVWQGFLNQSEAWDELKVVFLGEEEIFGAKKRVAKRSQWAGTAKATKALAPFKDLKVGDYVVHKEHGIGSYLGLRSMDFQGVMTDYVLLEYRDGDKLYIPVYRLNVIQKYAGGESGKVALDKMGGDRWIKAKKKAEHAVAELAEELLAIQAKRKMLPAFAFTPPGREYQEFEMTFPFDETPDQWRAIEAVMEDMGKPTPTDRLICGDVGYGKTEVALRAAYRAVLDGKQVVFLVPTTVLAFQHFETCKKRLKDLPVRVEMISRLKTSGENKKTLEELKDGKVDIVVGTHRLLSGDVAFKDLGLVVIDEEHRFGVIHKERLKKMCEEVHVIAMTATPIPRTLNMAMTGIKDISIITTPPPDRLSVRTFVCRESDEVVLEAISNELNRDGQIFFVHNRIESIFEVGKNLQRLLPRLKLEVVHGQMDGDELERKMLAFYRGEFHLLLTTTIIESGLDVPRANTIIIDQADHFGLAQLYQLRGRVGRADRRAYCYLLVPPVLSDDSKQRLQVIQRYTDLGAGFQVASHDMEIRGAGDLLGQSQSGHITAIGVDLYFELLEESVRALQGYEKATEIEPEINLRLPAFFPTDYLPDITERIQLYRRLSSVENDEQVSLIEEEIRDRFGSLPDEVSNLLGLMRLKLYLKRLHVTRLSAGPKKVSLQFAPTTPASPQKLVKLVQSDPKKYAITPDQKFVFPAPEGDWSALLREVQRLSEKLTED